MSSQHLWLSGTLVRGIRSLPFGTLARLVLNIFLAAKLIAFTRHLNTHNIFFYRKGSHRVG